MRFRLVHYDSVNDLAVWRHIVSGKFFAIPKSFRPSFYFYSLRQHHPDLVCDNQRDALERRIASDVAERMCL